MTTAGTSRFNLLSDEEIRALNQTVVEASNPETITIVGNPTTGSTHDAVSFGHHAEKIGADVMLVFYPERYYNDERIFEHFEQLSERTNVPLMLHAKPIRNASNRGPDYKPFSVALCQRLSELKTVIGMKEESGDESHRYKVASALSDEWTFVVAPASMRTFLASHHHGIQAWLTGVGSMIPRIEEDFYDLTRQGDWKSASAVVEQQETPFFNVAFPMGWHVAMKGAMDELGLMEARERRPLQPANTDERSRLKQVIRQLGWTVNAGEGRYRHVG